MNEARTWTRRAHYVIGVNDRVYTSASPTCTRTTTRQLGPDQAFHSLAISKCNAGRGNTSFLCPFPSYFYIFFGLILTVQLLLQGIFFFSFLLFFFLSCESGEMETAFDVLMRGWRIDDLEKEISKYCMIRNVVITG